MEGYTPLHCCLSSCCTEVELGMARLLLERGADPNARNRLGTVPLCTGLHVNSKESINLLLEFGVRFNCKEFLFSHLDPVLRILTFLT